MKGDVDDDLEVLKELDKLGHKLNRHQRRALNKGKIPNGGAKKRGRSNKLIRNNTKRTK